MIKIDFEGSSQAAKSRTKHLQSSLTAIDLFTGIGGWNVALSSLGISVVLAANHNAHSLQTNHLNFQGTQQVSVDIMTCETDFIPDVDIMTASPECTYQSTSSGVPLLNQLQASLPGFWTDRSHDDFVKRSRETMNGVHRWAEVKVKQNKPLKMIFVENVTDLRHWGGLQEWYQQMETLGYQHRTLSFNSMFARPFPYPVPQSRDRCYIVLWRKEFPAPNLDICPPAFCHRCGQEVHAIQCWSGIDQRFGEYGPQYDYRCPLCDQPLIPRYTPIEEYINWESPAPKIGERARPLCAKTMNKIHKGLRWYARDHHPQQSRRHAFLMSYYKNPVFRDITYVAGTVTTVDRHCLIMLPDDWSGGIPDVMQCGYRMCQFSEYQRMMGIPPDFRFECTKKTALAQLGLAVTPAAAVEVLTRGLRSLCPSIIPEEVA